MTCAPAGQASPRSPQRVQEGMVDRNDKRKQSLYFPEDMLHEIQQEATRQDRSLSWIIQQTWRLARARIASIPGMNDPNLPTV